MGVFKRGFDGWVLGYLVLTFAGMALFGGRAWLTRCESFTLLFQLAASMAPVHVSASGRRLSFGMPGWKTLQARRLTYGMAFFALALLASVPELTDISTEPKHILDMYGPDVERKGSFARNCLLARRLAERLAELPDELHGLVAAERVDDLPLAFVPPLGSDNDYVSHVILL